MVKVITRERMAEAQPLVDRISAILRRMLEINEQLAETGSFPDNADAEIDRLSHEHAELRAKLEALAVVN